MKLFNVFSLLSVFLLLSCSDDVQSHSQDDSFEQFELPAETIPKEFSIEDEFITEEEQLNENNKDKKRKVSLGLPSYYTDRVFLKNPLAYVTHLDKLVGMVVKKEGTEDQPVYVVIRAYKFDTVEVELTTPSNPKLVERKYDRKYSAGVKYLAANVSIGRKQAYQFLISDIGEAIIEDSQVDMLKLYNTYNNDPQSDKYYLVRSATSTSILNKSFSKMEAGAKFDVAAIKVESKYYSEDSSFDQNKKVGMSLVSVKEFLKGYTPPQAEG